MSATDWHAYDVGQLAGILNEDLSEGWNHVWAWTLATDMLNAARDQLEVARSSLAAAWTAEKSPAAQEFFNFVDAVSESMAATAEAATANRTAMQQVLDSQAQTQAAVNELHGSWQSWSHDALDPADAQSVMDDLNARAATHMTAADLVITDATNALVVPPVIDPRGVVYRPSLTPGTDGTNSGVAGTGTAEGVSSAGKVPRPPTVEGGLTPTSASAGEGGNEPPGSRAPIDIGRAGPGGSSSDAGTGRAPTNGPPDSVDGPPTTGLADAQGGRPPEAALFGTNQVQGGVGSSALRRGTMPGAESSGPRQPPLGAAGTVQPGPAGEIGYVDGSPILAARGSDALGTAGVEGGPVSPMMLGGNDWNSRHRAQRNRSGSPWEIPVGVPAVLVAAIESDIHDPGPGVIGIDR